MNFDWIKPTKVSRRVEVILEAIRVGYKPFWLVDDIKPVYIEKLRKEILKGNFCSGIILNELMVWYPANLSNLDTVPVIFDVPSHAIVEDSSNEILGIANSIISNAQVRKSSYVLSEKSYLIPTLIGILLGYPIVYKISDYFDEHLNTLNNCDLVLYKIYFKNELISTFSVPLSVKPKIDVSISQINAQLNVLSEPINLPSVCL